MPRRLITIATVLWASSCASAEERAGRWADNPNSCKGDRSGSGDNGANYQVMDLDKLTVTYFDGTCPLTEFVPRAQQRDPTSRVFRVVCHGEIGDGPPFWLFVARETQQLSIARMSLQDKEGPFHYALLRCP
jgi:hypothetical protein